MADADPGFVYFSDLSIRFDSTDTWDAVPYFDVNNFLYMPCHDHMSDPLCWAKIPPSTPWDIGELIALNAYPVDLR